MPRVLILSTTTGYQLRSFGDAAARSDIELMFATDRCHQLDDPWRDAAVAVRFHEEDASLDAIVAAARGRPVDGVIAVGDRPVVLAARAAAALRLPGNPPEAAAASVNKSLLKRELARAGLPVPWFFQASIDAHVSADPRVRYPCVIKPLGMSGSRGVIRANTPAELDAAVERVRALLSRKDVRATRSGVEDGILLEGFIAGREFAVEGVMTAGTLQTFAVFDKPDPLDGPFFEETIYVTPSTLDRSTHDAIVAQVASAAAGLGLANGPIHAECRVSADAIYILEMAARPIGGLCSKVLRFDGIPTTPAASLEDVLLRHAVGQDVSRMFRERAAAGVMMIPIPQKGMLKSVHGIDRASAVAGIEEIQITAKIDQLLEPLPEAASYLGFIFARGSEAREVVRSLKAAHAQLRFHIAAPIPVT
ncbi:MAG: ATP-grasp domain-containing protein [Vicinamibacterales bacterium]